MAETVLRDPLNLIRLIPAKGTREFFCLAALIDTTHINAQLAHRMMLHSLCVRLLFTRQSAKQFPLYRYFRNLLCRIANKRDWKLNNL